MSKLQTTHKLCFHTLYLTYILTHLRRGWAETKAQRYVLLIVTAFNTWAEVKLHVKALI